ncbi:MAG: hypothetical protein GY708_24470, partial [Actinomycetia bacterium]|nr:hypothetical protein [Actinomycetes bacterium]
DPDDDNDGVNDDLDPNDTDPDVCGDTDDDTCDDCTNGSDNLGVQPDSLPNNDGLDTDSDGLCDAGDPDDDNDGVNDDLDPNDTDPDICGDTDNDTCDDCTNGTDNLGVQPDSLPNNDGLDTDSDGLCDAGDPDDDNDGVNDDLDPNDTDPDICGDTDDDTCDDCAIGSDNLGVQPDNLPNNDGLDTDSDGLCDAGDPDDDNDGVEDPDDSAALDPQVCQDVDADDCDDCSENPSTSAPLLAYTPDITDDGEDEDGDGLCDAGDRIWFTPFSTHAMIGPQTIFRQAVYDIPPGAATATQFTTANLNALSNMVAMDVKANGKILFAVEEVVTVGNGTGTIKLFPGVIYRWTGSKIKVHLKPSTIGVSLNTINALDQVGGSYFFSVDANKTLRVDGVRYRLFSSQVWRLKPSGTPKLELVRDFTDHGFDNVDGVDVLPDGRYAISSKQNGPGYGIFHEHVYIWDPATDTVIEAVKLAPLDIDDCAGFTLIDDE